MSPYIVHPRSGSTELDEEFPMIQNSTLIRNEMLNSGFSIDVSHWDVSIECRNNYLFEGK